MRVLRTQLFLSPAIFRVSSTLKLVFPHIINMVAISIWSYAVSLFKKYFIYLYIFFREKVKGGESEGDRNINQGPGLQPRHVS